MERRMEAEKPECGGTMKQNGSGDAIRSLPASKQLRTKSCARCAGLLVTEWYYDLHNTGADHLETLRCVQCGHRVDPVILQNQIRPPVENHQVRQVQRKYSARTGMVHDTRMSHNYGVEGSTTERREGGWNEEWSWVL